MFYLKELICSISNNIDFISNENSNLVSKIRVTYILIPSHAKRHYRQTPTKQLSVYQSQAT